MISCVRYQVCIACNYAKPEKDCVRLGQFWTCIRCFESGETFAFLLDVMPIESRMDA